MDATVERSFTAPPELSRLQRRALVVGVVASLVAVAGLLWDRAHFFQAYLVAFLFWLAVALGCFGLSMLHHLTRGAWGVMARRTFEAAARTLPLLLVLFLPLLLGLHDLYHWVEPGDDEILQRKAAYLNVPFWAARAALYFAVWILIAWRLTRLSRRQDESGDPALFRRMQAWSAVGFLALALTGTFAAIDWLMSLDPHWFSSLFGLWFLAGMALSGLTFAIVVAFWLAQREPMAGALQAHHFHDYGKLLLAFVMLWAYLSISQLLLIWGANLPEEIPFYLRRLGAGWELVSLALLLGHFAVPFLLLLSSDLKKRARTLVKVALWLLAVRWLDFYWHVAPTLQAQHGAAPHHLLTGLWLDLAAVLGMGGIWVWFFLSQLRQRPLLPLRDPFLAEALRP
ncbi:MAG TPA: hypothetical protein VMT16_00315 [Thermoanaerobaculia bacterium]|nr:hypothetical protein [Thermoanaerobaculia bacterium]